MRIAVLGAGLAGSLAALELSEAGCSVDLYDRCAAPLSGASVNNEGKIHLGFVYAKDRSRATARAMIRGALAFRPLVSRWVDSQTLDRAVSDPFIYALHRDSMVGESEVTRHFQDVESIYAAMRRRGNGRYIADCEEPLWRRRPRSVHESLFDGELVTTSFETAERSVDPAVVARAVRLALSSSARLELRTGTGVLKVEESGHRRLAVHYELGGTVGIERYDAVINALWENRLAIDATLGLAAGRPVVHRYKAGLFSEDGARPPGYPTVTFLVGSYGDTVSYPTRTYMTWYPAGLLKEMNGLNPSAPNVGDDRKAAIVAESLAAMTRLMPGAADALAGPGVGRWQVRGGFISAWGRSGIEDPGSELHTRYAIGVSTRGNYHSIDTGKYTTAPLFAKEACARILDTTP